VTAITAAGVATMLLNFRASWDSTKSYTIGILFIWGVSDLRKGEWNLPVQRRQQQWKTSDRRLTGF